MVVGFLRKALILTSTCLRYSSLDQASQYSRLPQVLDTKKILGVVQGPPGLAVEVALPPDGLAAQIAQHVPNQYFVAGFYLPFDKDLYCHGSLLVNAGLWTALDWQTVLGLLLAYLLESVLSRMVGARGGGALRWVFLERGVGDSRFTSHVVPSAA